MGIADTLGPEARIRCSGALRRQFRSWGAISAEIVRYPDAGPFEFSFAGPAHCLAIAESGHRADGETFIDGLPPSRRRTLRGAMVLAPRGIGLRGWSAPRGRSAWLNLYIHPTLVPQPSAAAFELVPRLHFSDSAVLATASKLRELLFRDGAPETLYAETLGSLLVQELARGSRAGAAARAPGGLSAAHVRILRDFIHDRLADDITLAALADLVGLSPFHLARAFKQTLGMPPHRYLMQARVERAKGLLASSRAPITEVALIAGFASSSHFASTFRRMTGLTPRAYRRCVA